MWWTDLWVSSLSVYLSFPATFPTIQRLQRLTSTSHTVLAGVGVACSSLARWMSRPPPARKIRLRLCSKKPPEALTLTGRLGLWSGSLAQGARSLLGKICGGASKAEETRKKKFVSICSFLRQDCTLPLHFPFERVHINTFTAMTHPNTLTPLRFTSTLCSTLSPRPSCLCLPPPSSTFSFHLHRPSTSIFHHHNST